MPALALADALPDFGSARTPPPMRRAEPAFAAPEPPPVQVPVETDEERIARAVARAEAELAERLAKEYEEKLESERTRHLGEMQAAIADLGEGAAKVFERRFAEMEQNVAALASAVTARILGVALTEDLQKRAVDELARILKEAMKDREALRVRVRGTAFLCDALKAQLGERARQVDFTEASGLDLTAEIDESLFETRLAEWSEALAEVLS
jgi:hypothetical protein